MKTNEPIPGCLTIVFVSLLMASAGAGSAPKADAPSPIMYSNFVHGEKLAFEAGWNGISAASGAIVTERKPDRPHLYEIRATARTENLVGRLWRMRNMVKTIIDADVYRPVHMFLKQDENRKVSTRTVDFTYAENRIKVRRKARDDNITEEIFPLERNTYDPVSAAFLLRSTSFDVGDAIEVDVCDGKGIYRIRTKVEARENVKIGLGTFPSYRMTLTTEKIFPPEDVPDQKKKIKSITLWMSTHPARIPLRLESSVFIGHVYMELTHENRGLVASQTP